MKFCKDNKKCQECQHKDICEALGALMDAVEAKTNTVESDERIKKDVEELLRINGPMVILRGYIHMDKSTLAELAEVLVMSIDMLYRSWEHKCEEIDKLKVQLEAQETISHA